MKRLSLLFLITLPSVAHADMSKGEYIFRASDCMACHTAQGGKELAGGKKFPTPFGYIYSTNITPDKKYGIGNWNYNDFVKAVRKGVAKDGHHLYPAMPYPAYVKISDEDMKALYIYLMQDIKPQPIPNKKTDIIWPLSMRWPLTVWNFMYTGTERFVPRIDQTVEWNRGAYLVQGPGHCGTCHTPRGFMMQEKAFNENNPKFLSGAEIDKWYSPSLRGLQLTQQEIVDLLQKGRSKHKALAGPMDEVVSESTQYLTKEDAQAIAVYLQSLKDNKSNKITNIHNVSLLKQQNGQAIYNNYCSTCHGINAKGSDYVIPPLVNNPTVNSSNPLTLIRIIMEGGKTPETNQHLPYSMPGYAWNLKDQDLADLINYIRTHWGNNAAPVSSSDITKVRELIKNK